MFTVQATFECSCGAKVTIDTQLGFSEETEHDTFGVPPPMRLVPTSVPEGWNYDTRAFLNPLRCGACLRRTP